MTNKTFYCVSLSTVGPGEGPGPLPPPSLPPGPTTGGVGAPGTSSGGGAGKAVVLSFSLIHVFSYLGRSAKNSERKNKLEKHGERKRTNSLFDFAFFHFLSSRSSLIFRSPFFHAVRKRLTQVSR